MFVCANELMLVIQRERENERESQSHVVMMGVNSIVNRTRKGCIL